MPTPSEAELVQAIVGAAFEVSNVLGAGFQEKLYERALARELSARGLEVQTQRTYQVHYKGDLIGEYIPDLLVANQILVELRCADRLASAHIAQYINYLRATNLETALLINFQHPKVEWRCVHQRS